MKRDEEIINKLNQVIVTVNLMAEALRGLIEVQTAGVELNQQLIKHLEANMPFHYEPSA